MKWLAFTLLLLVLAACVPASTTSVTATDTLVSTASPLPTTTEVPSQTPPPVPTSTTAPTPGPDLAVLYINQGQIKHFDMHTWSEETLPLSNTIQTAELSSVGQMLAYGDETGLYLSNPPFRIAQKISSITVINTNQNTWSLIFNPDSNLLALSDAEGLKILHLPDNTLELLIKNNLIQEDGSDYKNHIPIAWSPDSRYLWIDAWAYEGKSSIIEDVISKQLSNYFGCYSDIAWLTKSTLIGTVYYSGRESCGFEPGVYMISLKRGQFAETRIYADELYPPEEQNFNGLSLSPSKKYVTIEGSLENSEERFLFLMDVNGGAFREISKSKSIEERLTSVCWSPSEQEVYYSSGKDIYVYSLEDDKSTLLYEDAKRLIEIGSISSDGKWLFLSNGTLLSTETGEAISLTVDLPENQEQVFIGWLENK